jgi:hypothetical protein
MRMGRFYLSVLTGGHVIPDREGEEFENLTDARQEAEAALRELVAEDIASAAPLQPRSIAIHDGDGHLLAIVRLSATLEIEGRADPEESARPEFCRAEAYAPGTCS